MKINLPKETRLAGGHRCAGRQQHPKPPHLSGGFSLVELLVVIAMIAVLISMVVPLVHRARQASYNVSCRENLKNIGTASNLQSTDHGGYIPGCYANTRGPLDWQAPWIGKEVLPAGRARLGWMDPNVNGTLYPYYGAMNAQVRNVYRCPANGEVTAMFTGNGSNGMFDYVSFKTLAGTRISSIPLTANLTWENNPVRLPTPLYTEEDYNWNLNVTNIDPGFSNEDYIASVHPNTTGNYSAVDGSVNSVRAGIAPNRRAAGQFVGPIAWAWSLDVGGGKWADIADSGVAYGEWVKRKR